MTTQPDGKNAPRPEDTQPEMPLVEHLLELRNRLLKMVLAVIICFAAIYPFANELYLLISQPLRDLLPVGQTMIATDITSPFFAPLKLALVLAVFVESSTCGPYTPPYCWFSLERDRILIPEFRSGVRIFTSSSNSKSANSSSVQSKLVPLFKTIVPTICPSTTSKHLFFDLSVHPVSASPMMMMGGFDQC